MEPDQIRRKLLKSRKLESLFQGKDFFSESFLALLKKQMQNNHTLQQMLYSMDLGSRITKILPGDEIWIYGIPGKAGSELLCTLGYSELSSRFCETYLFEEPVRKDTFEQTVLTVKQISKEAPLILPVGESGIFSALYELGKVIPFGFRISYGNMPKEQKMIEICEFLDLNLWNLFSSDCFLVVTKKNSCMKDAGLHKIGKISEKPDKTYFYKERESSINKRKPDELLLYAQKILHLQEE